MQHTPNNSHSHPLRRTPLHAWHEAAGAKLVDFAGWEMPVQYAGGIIHEHLATRRTGGLFDVSHMGRFVVSGRDALPFLQATLTNDAAALRPGLAQYTLLADEQGAAVDDAYLYQWQPGEYLLVVNAGNRDRDWRHLDGLASRFAVHLADVGELTAMIAVQGPQAATALRAPLAGELPENRRNRLSIMQAADIDVLVARTGYTGEPIGFELILPSAAALPVWQALLASGLEPVGLGARDTLRLEAGLPLFGHEYGCDPAGQPIPIFASPPARQAVKFTPAKGDFVGRQALLEQADAWRRLQAGLPDAAGRLPRLLRPFRLADRGVARAGAEVWQDDRQVGWVTSGTMVPYWLDPDASQSSLRAIGLALVDASLDSGATPTFVVRGKQLHGQLVDRHLDQQQGERAIPVPATAP